MRLGDENVNYRERNFCFVIRARELLLRAFLLLLATRQINFPIFILIFLQKAKSSVETQMCVARVYDGFASYNRML